MRQTGEGISRSTLPTLQASARRRNAARKPDAVRAPPKPKRTKRASTLGGRLAAAIRMTRLRAIRAAEERR
jgi:hypothetical protein